MHLLSHGDVLGTLILIVLVMFVEKLLFHLTIGTKLSKKNSQFTFSPGKNQLFCLKQAGKNENP